MAVSSTSRMAGRVGADQVEVLAGLQPVALDQRIGRHGGGADDVGRTAPPSSRSSATGRPIASAVARVRLQTVKRASGKALRIGLDHDARHGACADQKEVAAVLAGQALADSRLSPAVFHLVTRWKSTRAVSSPVTSSKRLTIAVDRRLAARGVAGDDGRRP